jgi:hypothetical protein
MPIRLNLLAEALATEDMRRRDPVKRAIFGGALLVALALVWSSSLLLEDMLANTGLAQVDSEIQTRTNEYSLVTANLKKIAETQRKLDALQHLSASRFFQGDLLNALQQIYVPNVKLMRFRVDQTYLYKEGSPTQTNSFGNVMLGHPGIATEKIVLSLDARDSSANPGGQMNIFKENVIKQPYFETRLDKTNGLRLSNVTAPQIGPDGHAYVLFTLECRYIDQTR